MIKHITYRATFSATGRSLSGDFSPQPGVTAVVGRNGSGKSFGAVEVPRWLLFGSKALRGVGADYRPLEGEGTFVIRDKTVTIERGGKGGAVLREQATGTILAVGENAVTAEVTTLLGYGLDVFDVANASVQGETNLFGRQRPAERKRLIDKVVGLTSTEAIEKLCREQAKLEKGIAEALSVTLRQPEEPQMPGNERVPLAIYKTEMAKANEWRTLNAQMVFSLEEPTPPTMDRPDDEGIEALAALEAIRPDRERRKAALEKAIASPRPVYTEAELCAAEQRNIVRAELEDYPEEPDTPRATLVEMLELWEHINTLKKIGATKVACPVCEHEFYPAKELPDEPDLAVTRIRLQLAHHEAWDNRGPRPDLPAGPDLGAGEIASHRAALVRYEAVDAARSELAALVVPPNMAIRLAELREAQKYWTNYDQQRSRYDSAVKNNEDILKQIMKLGPIKREVELDDMNNLIHEWDTYDRLVNTWEAALDQLATDQAKVAEHREMAEAWLEGAKNLGEARTLVKANLSPMLSRVASAILWDMTGGVLSTVFVDEEMEISVDGQRLETLSGAGETAANLALRIALGQILVGKAFPVFLGDEIDSNADEARRDATRTALSNLTGRLDQIILVSHRPIVDADNTISMDS